MVGRRTFRRTTILSLSLCALLAGLAIGKNGPAVPFYAFLVLLIPAAVLLPKRNIPSLLVCVLAGLMGGYIRGGIVALQLAPLQQLAGQKISVIVTADSDSVYGNKSQLTFDGGRIVIESPHKTTVPGRLKISGFGEAMIYKGDRVRVSGKLYLTRGSRQGSISFAQIERLATGDAVIDGWRRHFAAGMQSALPEPAASFGLGLLIGQRSTLPERTTEELSAVGLTHIIAVSGYNLTIIVEAVRRFGKRRSKYQNLLLSVMLIVVFLLVTGFSASIVRAAIVSMLSMWAWYYGRTIKPVLLLLLAAGITAAYHPMYLWSDIGWYLSFLAFFGVIVLSPLLIRRFYVKRQPGMIASIIIETSCAQLMTVPLILFIFNETSPIALFGNLVIVPFVPLAMLFALIAGVAGVFMPVLAGIVAIPARVLLTYMLDTVSLLARLPYVSVEASLRMSSMLTLYAVVVIVAWVLWHRTRPRYDKITDDIR